MKEVQGTRWHTVTLMAYVVLHCCRLLCNGRVKDVMTATPITVRPETGLDEAAT